MIRTIFKHLFVFCCFFFFSYIIILKSFHHIVNKLTTVYRRGLMTRFLKREIQWLGGFYHSRLNSC